VPTLINDPWLEERLKRQRQAWGVDCRDEVWKGVYMMAPFPNDEHQKIVSRLVSILEDVIGWPELGEVRPGVNLAALEGDWEQDYRIPDVAVFLREGVARNCDTHWRGPADFLVEITSPGDQSREKLAFYSRIGVKELLLLDRQSWRLELYRLEGDKFKKAGQSTVATEKVLASQSVPLEFQLVAGPSRPQIRVSHPAGSRSWLV